MGYGPVPAIQKALKCAGLTMADMDIIEVRGETSMRCCGLGHHTIDCYIKCLKEHAVQRFGAPPNGLLHQVPGNRDSDVTPCPQTDLSSNL
jgi:hypothetical protein